MSPGPNMHMIRFEDLLLRPNTLLSMTLRFTRNICRNDTKADTYVGGKKGAGDRCIKEKQNLTLPDINCRKLTALLRNQQRPASHLQMPSLLTPPLNFLVLFFVPLSSSGLIQKKEDHHDQSGEKDKYPHLTHKNPSVCKQPGTHCSHSFEFPCL